MSPPHLSKLALVLGTTSQNFFLVLATLGVAPQDEAKYSSGVFRCTDGSGGLLTPSVVNDEFCHCTDGSDEPGTGACAGQDKTLFFCANGGSVAKRIYASRVGDGICDCCDGSDEASLAARVGFAVCKNVCVEEGQREREELERRAAVIKKGVERQHEIRMQAVVERANWRWERSRLRKELPSLEARLAEVRKRAAALKEAEEQEKALASNSSSDSNTSSTVGSTAEAIATEADGSAEASQDSAVGNGADAKPQVSEYAKWMDGAESTLNTPDKGSERKDAGSDATATDAAPVSEYTKWMDGAEKTISKAAPLSEDDEEEQDSEDGDDLDEDAEYSYRPNKVEVSRTATLTGGPEEQEAQRAVNKNKDRTKELESKLEALNEEHLGYASLLGKTISRKVGEFTYKMSFFERASQDHTSLGVWKGFTGAKTAEFAGGASCWQGPERMLKVAFECGAEAEIQDVVEPSRCVYAATVLHPGACDPTEVETLKVDSRVVGPRDEL